MNSISQLVHLSYQFGPFAFALIFLIVMARWGQKKWGEVCTRKKPAASDAEKSTYRFYFIGVTSVGVVLVGVSVYWWWTHQPIYLYEGQIETLAETDTVEGTNVYVRNEYYKQDPDSPQFRDVHFLIKQTEPFEDGQDVNLRYFRDRRLAKPLRVKVALSERPTFSLEYDDTKDEWQLKRRAKPPAGKGTFISEVFAQSSRQVKATSPERVPFDGSIQTKMKSATLFTPFPENAAERDCVGLPAGMVQGEALLLELQAPGTLVSRKVELLDELYKFSDKALQGAFFTRVALKQPLSEPVFVTVMDLTRHTDKELSSKAKRVLTKAPLPTDYFHAAAVSKNAKCRTEALNMFLRLDPPYAYALIAELEKIKIDATVYKQLAREGDHWRLLVPTGTPAGDKYFMEAAWKEGDEAVRRCISDISPLLDSAQRRSPELRSPWSGSTIDKAQIIRVADGLKKCGAKTKFVGFYALK